MLSSGTGSATNGAPVSIAAGWTSPIHTAHVATSTV
jgi:hypothetical protein